MKMRTIVLAIIILVFAGVSQAQYAQQKYSQLTGHVTVGQSTPAKGVILTIGGYSTVTDGNGYYKFDFLRRGNVVVQVTPPRRRTRSFTVMINGGVTTRNFAIDW